MSRRRDRRGQFLYSLARGGGMTSKQSQLRRAVEAAKREKEEFAGELKRGLLLLHYVGQCKCGLMLTERDRNQRTKKTYSCPHCGVSGPLVAVVHA